MSKTLLDYVHFADRKLEGEWAGRVVPMSTVYEAYLDGRIDIPEASWDRFFADRHDLTSFKLTAEHVKWAFTNFIPEVMVHSLDQDSRVVGDNYNRGNDFYAWFLGEAMVYTAAWYESPTTPLAQAQYAKIDRCCEKLRLRPGETLLDIGCGWGTFVSRAAAKRGAKAHGVTLAREQVEYGTARIKREGAEGLATMEVCDFRDVKGTFDKIVSLEMVEHVGIKNLDKYFVKVHELLADDGLFVLQWTGIRKLYSPRNPLSAVTLRGEDLIWGLS
jgi:2-polyprenyl-3-methyl-5-hydroxy-6-metoxy-1,4-benzoquinol methylase